MSDEQVIAGRYRLRERLGSGGMGVVWQAHDERLRRTVAVKQVHVPAGLTGSQSDELIRRTMREGRIAARLHHPQLITMYDVIQDGGRPYLIMEYFPSASLADLGTLPFAEVAHIGAEAAAALAAAHRSGVVHRDIKPANLLVGADGTVKITDFGISRVVEDLTATMTGMFAGTPAYLAPEVAKGGQATFASDVYSLGATLYTAVEGGPPAGRDTNPMAVLYRVANGEITPPKNAGPLTDTLMWLLSTAQEARPTMAQAVPALSAVAKATAGGRRGVWLPQPPPNGERPAPEAQPSAALAGPAAAGLGAGAAGTRSTDPGSADASADAGAADDSSADAGSSGADAPDAGSAGTDSALAGSPAVAAATAGQPAETTAAPAAADSTAAGSTDVEPTTTDPTTTDPTTTEPTTTDPTTTDGASDASSAEAGPAATDAADNAPAEAPDDSAPAAGAADSSEEPGRTAAAAGSSDPLPEPSPGAGAAPNTAQGTEKPATPTAEPPTAAYRRATPTPGTTGRPRARVAVLAAGLLVVALVATVVIIFLNRTDAPGDSTNTANPPGTSEQASETTSAGGTAEEEQSPTGATQEGAPEATTQEPPPPTENPPAAPATADAALSAYYATMPAGRTAAWQLLTPKYQASTARGREGYERFWRNIAAVVATDVVATDTSVVEATITYTFNDGHSETERHRYWLVNQNGTWLIDQSTVLSTGAR